MPFWRRRVELAPVNVPDDWATGDAWRAWPSPRNWVRGESHHRKELRQLCGGEPRGTGYLMPVEVDLIREPRNPYDRNAIRVEVDGWHVGYIGREIAMQLAPVFDSGRLSEVRVCGVLRGGAKTAPDLGVHIWLDKRLSPGFEASFADTVGAVPWPPSPHEGVYCSADDA
jgi:hypothetical protein